MSLRAVFILFFFVVTALSAHGAAHAEVSPFGAAGRVDLYPSNTLGRNFQSPDSATSQPVIHGKAIAKGTEGIGRVGLRPPLPKAPPSAFEEFVSGKVPDECRDVAEPSSLCQRLIKIYSIKQFGYDLFREPPGTFAPVESMPVGPGYTLGPGDELKLALWGKINAEYTLSIDREGKVVLPEVGVVHLAGLTFAEAREFLFRELGRYYKLSEVKMNLGMGRLSTITVFVVGKARRPGSYTLSSLSTVLNALIAAGGPAKVGSMRDIHVKRSGETIARLDLYDLLLKGDKTGDVRLQSDDVIFIPPSGPLAGVTGSIRAPAIYELKGEKSAADLIEMAGGLNDIAFKGRIQIERVVDSNRETVLEANLEDVKLGDIAIKPADLVNVFPVVRDRRVLRLSGAVQREGEFGASPGVTVSELIEMAGGLKYYAYTPEAELTRVNITQNGPVTEKVLINLEGALTGDPAHDIRLKENDYLFVRAVPEWELYRTVKIKGEVRFPGTYTIKKGETVSSLIERAGGFTDKAYLKGAVFTRDSVREIQQKQLDESISRLEHEILLSSAGSIEAALTPEDARRELVAVEQKRALISKMKAARAKGRVSLKLTELERFRGSPSDLPLEDGDTIHVPETPSQVQVIGAVYNQTAFVYDSRASVDSYIRKAGGVTKNAAEDEIYVLKVDGTAVSKREGASAWTIRWDSSRKRWASGDFMSLWLDPGDTIVVPEKIERVVWLREVKDITQILYQIAVTAGVLIVAF